MDGLSHFETILVLGPHTDDGEFGAGATIAKLIETGKNVYYAMFSLCEESVPENLPKDILYHESKASANILGIPSQNLIYFHYPVRKFPEYRQEILEDMIKIRNSINPDLVILPSKSDLHQDHETISNEGFRAFKSKSIIGYEIIWNNLSFPTQIFSEISEKQLSKKIAALNEYRSQFFRSYAKESFIRSQAIVRGTQINKQFAESFEVIRWII